MGLTQRSITEFWSKPHSVSEMSEAPINGANMSPVEMGEMGLRQRFITEFCPHSSGALRAQLTLTGDIIPIRSKDNNGRNPDRNTRLFHFFIDPSPVLTIAKTRIIRNDNAHIKLRLPDDLLEKLERHGRIEVHHFTGIREEHPYNIEKNYLRICTGKFYTGFYDRETALVKSTGDKLIIVTKVGHHPRDYLQFRNVEYRNMTGSAVKTSKGRIVPLSFYIQAVEQFPSVVEVIGKARKVRMPKKMKEKRYISAPED